MYKVAIRKLSLSDMVISYKWRNDAEIWKYTGNRPDRIITHEDELNWFIKNDNDARYNFAILVDGSFVGICYLKQYNKNESWELSLFIGDKNYWGKGVGNQTVKLLIEFYRRNLSGQPLYLTVRSEHAVAISLYKKHNFKILCEVSNHFVMLYDNAKVKSKNG